MKAWDELVKRALLGTERDLRPIPSFGASGADEGAVERPIEDQLLDAAALASLARRAGRRANEAKTPLPEPSPDEPRPAIGRRATVHAMSLLYEPRHRELLGEWLDAVAAAERVVTPRLLPGLLEVGRRQPKFAERIRAVVGARGLWLAAHNDAWAYARGETADLDAAPDRPLALRRLRESDPDAARQRIEELWASERAKDRASFVETLTIRLSMADEPFLESCLDDRAKDVRRAAARLLARLPESRLAERMLTRATAYVRFTDAWEVTLPPALDEAMARDGIQEKGAAEGGARTWWLTQILRATPPGRLSSALDRPPEDLIDNALESEWRRTLLEAISAATLAYQDDAWAEALLERRVEGDLWLVLSAPRREALFARMLVASKARAGVHRTLLHLPKLAGPWSPAFSTKIVAALRQLVASEERLGEFPAFGVLRDAGAKLAPEVLPAMKKLVDGVPETSYWKKATTDGLETLERRATMLAAIHED